MSIRIKIALLFTLLVSLLLFIAFWSVNKWLVSETRSQFRERLRTRAQETAGNWQVADDAVRFLPHDSGTTTPLQREFLALYSVSGKKLGAYAEASGDELLVPTAYIRDAADQGEYYFSIGNRDGYAFRYSAGASTFIGIIAARDDYRRTVVSELKQILWVIGILSVFIALLSGLFFSNQLLRPLKRIITDVNQISSTNLFNRISVGGKSGELNKLADTFNQLLERLEGSFIIQRRFVSNASHELSTPLTSMSSQLEVSLQQPRSVEDYQRVVRSVLDEVRVMQQLTTSLLEIARTGSEGTIELTDVRVDEVLMRSIAAVQKAYDNTAINIHFGDFPEDENECIVPGNAELLYVAFKNIIENGVKYSGDGVMNINLLFASRKVIVDFMNKGDVLNEEEQEKIFHPFFRRETVTDKPGFGLGLTLTRRIIKLHNGIIRVSSEPEAGTIFHLEFYSKRFLEV